MNRQEVFDRAVSGLRSQGFEKSMDEGTCSYRANDGKKCAIGWLVDDANYDPTLEGRGANCDEVIEMARIYDVKEGDTLFLAYLQQVHDYATNPKDMQKRLMKFAEEYGLDSKEIYA